nr:MAG TPA: hypothetical protein [Bacteriophage sp.]
MQAILINFHIGNLLSHRLGSGNPVRIGHHKSIREKSPVLLF